MGYHTKQKERILDLLKTCAGEHLTVSDLGKQLEENGTPVGTATIYRYLEQLTEEGVLRKYILDGKSSACYQYLGEHATCQEHFHLKCLSCGTLFHVQCTFLDEMQAHIAATIISRLTIPKRYFMDIVSSARMPSKKKNRKKSSIQLEQSPAVCCLFY